MSATIFLLVIGAAALHALWNALVKAFGDKSVAMSAVVIGQGLCGAAALAFVPFPGPAAWPYLAASVVCHLGYQEFLKASYRIGDLTQVYPIARGAAPMLVAAVSVGALGVVLSRGELFAVALIGCGIASLALVRRGDGMRNGPAAGLALITGCFIAAYSLVDGFGARAGGTGVGFFGVVAAANAVVYVATTAAFRPHVLRGLPGAWPVLIFGGGASFAAYAMVVFAFLHAPIALVSALRETSIVFALLIGVGFLKEPLNLMKVISTMITISGAALLRLAKT